MQSRPRRRTQSKSAIKRLNSGTRALLIGAAIIMGGIMGTLSSIGWGRNFGPRDLSIAGLGVLHRIALPSGISTKADIKHFYVDFSGADDYARMSINNYVVFSTEQPNIIVSGTSEAVNKFTNQYLVRRKFDIGLRRDKAGHLHKGHNFVVYELENRLGYCSGAFDLTINTQNVEGIPGSVPVDAGEIHSLIGGASPSLEDALCSRRIIQIDLGEPPDPLSRFRNLLRF